MIRHLYVGYSWYTFWWRYKICSISFAFLWTSSSSDVLFTFRAKSQFKTTLKFLDVSICFACLVYYLMARKSLLSLKICFITVCSPLQLHYLRLPKDLSEDYVILMDSTVSTGAAALMAVRVLLVSHFRRHKGHSAFLFPNEYSYW